MTKPEVYSPRLIGILRIVSALLFIEHGTQKLFDFPTSDHDLPVPFSILWTGAILELGGGLLLLAGVVARPVAFVLSGEMAVAYWLFHAPSGPYPANNGGDAAILFCFIFLFIAAAGPGAFSLDRSRARKSKTATAEHSSPSAY